MKTLRFYKLATLSLLLLNAITLFFLWNGPGHHGRPERNELVEHLGIEGTAREKILTLQDDHFKRKGELMDKSRRLHEELFSYFNNACKDSSAVAAKIDQIVENQRNIEQMTFDYFKQISSFCSEEQKKELGELLHELLRRSAGPPKR